MRGQGIDLVGRPDLAQASLIEHRHPPGDRADDGEVVRDEDVGGATIGLKPHQQIEDHGLNRDIERGG